MRVHEIGIARGGSSRAHKASQKEGQSEGEPRTAPQVSQHAVAERQAEMTERHRRDDHDLDSLTARRVDRVADERTGDVARVARIRCGEYDDAHAPPTLMRKPTSTLRGRASSPRATSFGDAEARAIRGAESASARRYPRARLPSRRRSRS